MSGEKYTQWESEMVKIAVRNGRQPHEVWPKLVGRTLLSVVRKFEMTKAKMESADIEDGETSNERADAAFQAALRRAIDRGLERMPPVDRDCEREDFRPVKFEPVPITSICGSAGFMCVQWADPNPFA